METEKIEVNIRFIEFCFTPAETDNKPVIFIFHGHGFNKSHSAFKSPNFNVVCPIDDFGYEDMDSWCLGEKGDFFWLDAMREIQSDDCWRFTPKVCAEMENNWQFSPIRGSEPTKRAKYRLEPIDSQIGREICISSTSYSIIR